MEKQGGIYARYSPRPGPKPDLNARSPGRHVPRKRRKPKPKSASIPNPPQNSPTLTLSETSSSKHLMRLK